MRSTSPIMERGLLKSCFFGKINYEKHSVAKVSLVDLKGMALPNAS